MLGMAGFYGMMFIIIFVAIGLFAYDMFHDDDKK